jgi:energy-coupling factor transporter ATP-binding protein EcfA2
LSRDVVINAFLPSAGIEDPHRFAGRRDQIKELTNALYSEGSVPLILGQRGLGKSSLALQMSRIAKGDVELLTELELERLALGPERQFMTFFVSCTDATKNLTGLLQLMINAVEAQKFELAKGHQDKFAVVDKTTRRSLSLKLFTAETTKKYEVAMSELNTKKFSNTEKLVHLTETLTDIYGQPVLFIVDEIDRIAPIKGLASFLKSHSSSILKFALVGIGANQGELISDHASIHRQIMTVMVKPMSQEELESIVERTEEYLTENDEPFEFSPDARKRLARVAAGFPWFVHVIGQSALLLADDAGTRDVVKKTIDEAITDLASNRFARMYYDLYQQAIRDSPPREYLLRLCALWNDEDIPTSEIYPKAKRLGVTAPSNYLGHLTQVNCGSVLVRSHQQSRALYRFKDEMFKVYVRARPSLYEGFKEQAEAAMRV